MNSELLSGLLCHLLKHLPIGQQLGLPRWLPSDLLTELL
jgi:hypothetical protein